MKNVDLSQQIKRYLSTSIMTLTVFFSLSFENQTIFFCSKSLVRIISIPIDAKMDSATFPLICLIDSFEILEIMRKGFWNEQLMVTNKESVKTRWHMLPILMLVVFCFIVFEWILFGFFFFKFFIRTSSKSCKWKSRWRWK